MCKRKLQKTKIKLDMLDSGKFCQEMSPMHSNAIYGRQQPME